MSVGKVPRYYLQQANSYPLNNIFWTPFAPILVSAPYLML